MSRSPDDLTEHENKLLGGWIRGLFETEGINDEVMSMCRPNEFHLLVATLFDQNLKACQAKVLTLETLRGSFECKYINCHSFCTRIKAILLPLEALGLPVSFNKYVHI